jgi:hypothetical protein
VVTAFRSSFGDIPGRFGEAPNSFAGIPICSADIRKGLGEAPVSFADVPNCSAGVPISFGEVPNCVGDVPICFGEGAALKIHAILFFALIVFFFILFADLLNPFIDGLFRGFD